LQITLFDSDPEAPRLSPTPARRRAREAQSPLRVAVLGSGSSGNAVVVESGDARLLIDAGFSCRELERRLAAVGVRPDGFAGIVLTHEHVDHCRGVDRFCRQHATPLHLTAGTLEGVKLSASVGERAATFRSGSCWEIGPFRLEAFLVPHDAREPVGLVIEDEAGRRVGLVADLGNRSRLAWGRLTDLDLLILETNHDLSMLRNGPYPWVLKQRVAGRHGHLSNREAADGLPELLTDRLRHVVLYHLSRTNNQPALAATEVGEVLDRERCPAAITVSQQDRPTGWLEIE